MDAVAELTAPSSNLRLLNTVRLIPSRYPSVGILDVVASPDDLNAIIELESWTNDRISTELGIIRRLPEEEWVTGQPMSSVVMAAFCHPRPDGGRFNSGDRGAWYAGRSAATAHAEAIFHRTEELAEIGVHDTFVHMRAYIADFHDIFHDLREHRPEYQRLYDPVDYHASQAFARQLLRSGSNGIIYRSVRDLRGQCIVCFRPKLVQKVRQGPHFEYRWTGPRIPSIRQLP
jgi:RES domain